MNGKDLKKLLRLNYLTQEQAAELFNVSRETVSRWCNSETELPIKTQQNITSKLRLKLQNNSEIIQGDHGVVNNGEMNNPYFEHKQYYSDSPDVLRATIELLEERIREKDAQIREKDAQIREKDAQINKLLEILGKR